MKIVQKQASAELLKDFNIGDVILTPLMSMVCPFPLDDRGRRADAQHGEAFYFTPLFFYVDWTTVNPIGLRGRVPVIAYRTTDPNDPVAIKSRSAQTRKEQHPDFPKDPQMQIRHTENLNYVVRLQRHDLGDVTFIMTFSKGEHFSGSKFASLIRMRNASIFDCVFEGRVGFRPGNGSGDWWGVDVSNPTDESVSPWVTAEEHEQYAKDFESYEALFSGGRLKADESNPDDEVPEGDQPAAAQSAGATKVRPRF